MNINSKVFSKTFSIFSILIIIISLISVVFPALLIRLTSSTIISPVDPFELGAFAIPLLLVNLLFLISYFFYRKQKFPIFFQNFLNAINTFDISKKFSLIILSSFVIVYAGFTTPEIFEPEPFPDSKNVLDFLNNWKISNNLLETINQYHTKLFFLTLSQILFGNIHVIPFLTSISLLVLSYFFTVQLTSKNISGLIAVAIILQSFIFREYDTTFTYTSFWVVFYILSLYVIKKRWPLSILSFIAAFFSKPLILAYTPFSILFILNSDLSFKNKILAVLPYLVIPSAFTLSVLIFSPLESSLNTSNFLIHPPRFLSGFSILAYQLRSDLFILLTLFPVFFLLYRQSKSGFKHAQSMMILISGMILSGSILVGFFNYQINPYRLTPLVVFFAISVGMLFKQHGIGKN